MTRSILNPLTPIFDPRIRRGAVDVGEAGPTLASYPAVASATVVTVPASVPSPTASVINPVCDDFNRADSNSLGGNWATTNGAGLQIVSNQAAARTTIQNNTCMWNVAHSSDNHWIEVDAINASASGNILLLARANTGASAPTDRYEAFWDRSSSGKITVRKVVAGSPTTLGSATGLGNPAGQRFRLEVNGTTIRALVDGVQQVSVTDGAITSGKYVGIRLDDPNPVDRDTVDNFCTAIL